MNNILLKEQRCSCGKLLLKGIFFHATLEIKCKKCGKLNQIGSIKDLDSDRAFLLVFNARGLITNASDAACHILEYSHDELVGKHFSEIDLDTAPEIFQKLMPPHSILTEEHYLQLEAINRTKSGKKLAVNIILKLYKPDEGESYVLLSAVLKDKNYQQVNGEENVKFIEHACDFYFEIDKEGVCKSLSPSIEKLFGISPEIGLVANYYDFVPSEKRAETIERFEYFVSHKNDLIAS